MAILSTLNSYIWNTGRNRRAPISNLQGACQDITYLKKTAERLTTENNQSCYAMNVLTMLKSIIPLALMCTIVFSSAAPVHANDDLLSAEAAYVDSVVQDQKWQSGLSYVNSMHGQVESMHDYAFDSHFQGIKKNELKSGGGRYCFKKDKRVRVEIKSGGINNGAVVVRKEDGTVRGAGGGVLRFVRMTLDPNSRILDLPNGYNVLKADLATLIEDVEEKARDGAEVKLSKTAVTDKRWHTPVNVVDVTKGDHLLERIFVDSKAHVPVEWDLYRDGKLLSITTFKNFKPNSGLADNLFEL